MSNASNNTDKKEGFWHRGLYGKSPKLKTWQRVFMITGGIVGLVWWVIWGQAAIWNP